MNKALKVLLIVFLASCSVLSWLAAIAASYNGSIQWVFLTLTSVVTASGVVLLILSLVGGCFENDF